MADNIISATQQVERLNTVFNQHTVAIERSVDQLEKLNAQYAIVPGDFIRNQREITKLEADQARARATLERERITTLRRLQTEEQNASRARINANRERQSEIRLQETQARQTNRVNREREREARQLARNTGLYNAVQRRLRALTVQYNDLAVRKRLFNNLTDREEGFLQQLTTTINRYQTSLQRVDANIGNFRRNVGNYATAWNGLGNSLNQLTREAPAFAQSVQVGFLAISNNLPILVDEVDRLVKANQNLAAQGQPTVSVIRQITNAFLSWQTAISLGVTLLTIYGAEIVEWIQSLFKAEEQIEEVALSQERLNEIQERAAESTSREISELNVLSRALGSLNVPQQERQKALEQLQSLYPDYFSNLSLEKSSYEDITVAVKSTTNELLRQALAKAVLQEIEGVEATRLQTIIQTERTLRDLNRARNENNAALEVAIEEFRVLNEFASANSEEISNNTALQAQAGDESLRLAQRIESLRGRQDELTQQIDEQVSLRQEANREANREISLLTNLSNFQSLFNSILDDAVTSTEALTGAKRGSLEFQRQLIQQLESERESLAVNSEEYIEYSMAIADANRELRELQAFLTGVVVPTVDLQAPAIPDLDLDLSIPDQDEVIDALQVLAREAEITAQRMTNSFQLSADEQRDIFRTLFSSFAQMYNIDLRAFTNLIANKEATTADYVDAAVEAANFILNATRQNFELELEAQRMMLDEVLNNELASEEQKQIARERFEAREREIRTRQARAERTAAIIQVGIDTAAAIVKTLAQLGPAGIPIIPIVAAIGAAQAAFIAAQPLPQFEKGTDNAPEGWAITQEKRPEPITDKKGNIKTLGLKGGPKYTWLEKGDKVYKNMNEFLSKNPTNEAMMIASQETNQRLKMSDSMIMLDYAFATIKDDIVSGSKEGVRQGLKGFKVINNIKNDIGHEIWKKNKGYA